MGVMAIGAGPQAGEPAADGARLDALFRSARPTVLSLVRRVLDHAEAEDVTQEVFLKLGDDPVRHRPNDEVTAWLRRVALNLAFNRARDVQRWRDRAVRAGQPDNVQELDPAAVAVREDERAGVRAVLAQLPQRQRDCLMLRHAGYSYAEIAATLELPASSIGTTLARGERAFREHYLSANADPTREAER